MEYILLIIGIFLLLKGADLLVDGSSSLAKKMGISTLVIGLTVVSFGTSAPELIVNIIAATGGNSDVALGNIIGSNLANILLVLGISALLIPLCVQHSTTWKEIPFSLLAAGILFILANKLLIDGTGTSVLSRTDGFILLAFFIIFLYYAFEMARNDQSTKEGKKAITQEDKDIKAYPYYKSLLLILGGLVGLYFGGRFVVEGAVKIATQLNISEFLISATVIAVGTSLPELMTSVIAAKKKEVDLAVGNVIGSNIFNIFFILGTTTVITPVNIQKFINDDIIILLMVTLLLFLYMFLGKKHVLQKWQGGTFLTLYLGYLTFLIIRG